MKKPNHSHALDLGPMLKPYVLEHDLDATGTMPRGRAQGHAELAPLRFAGT